MSYRLRRRQEPAEEIRRVGLEQIERAIRDIADAELPETKRIHSLRKHFKKLRSLVRLLSKVDPGFARRESHRFRQLGRMLSDARDADVVVATLDGLSGKRGASRSYKSVRRALMNSKPQPGGAAGSADRFADVENRLQEAREAFLSWEPNAFGYEQITAEFVRRYDKGRKAFDAVCSRASTERRHEWRKRTKDCWYEMRLLRSFWKGPSQRRSAELKKLSLWLGRDHDLAVLSRKVKVKPRRTNARRERRELLADIERQRDRLFDRCRELGAKLFGESRKRWARRVRVEPQAALSSR